MTAAIPRQLCVIVIAAMSVLIAAIGVAVVILCRGHLIYSYDDPYIALALSQHIAHGHYGINASEVSSPSSSILFPFLLAAFARFEWQEWVPAVINALAACATAVLIARELCRLEVLSAPPDVVRAALLTVVLCVALNTVTLVYIGLEHSLHVLTSVIVVLGLVRALEAERVPPWLVPAIVLLPLWRFEGIAFAGISILALLILRRWLAATAAGLGLVFTLGAYGVATRVLGLPLLPSSVLMKSPVARLAVDGSLGFFSLINLMLHRVLASIKTWEAWPVLILLGLVAAHPVLRASRHPALRGPFRMRLGRETAFAAIIVCTLATHVLLGSWGWLGRYESYAVAIGAVAAIVIWRTAIAGLISRGSTAQIAVAAVTLLVIGNVYVISTLRSPRASLGIFEQQYQMHRFAVDFYQHAVGVNDLGWVSYRNPNYVLDLAGLGSESTRIALTSGRANAGWMASLVAAHHVGLVMIYDSWYVGHIPAQWQRIAALRSADLVTASSNVVTLYATSPEYIEDALNALISFSHHTAAGTELVIL